MLLNVASYPIHSSTGGRLVGFATNGDARKCSSSARVYRFAMVSVCRGLLSEKRCDSGQIARFVEMECYSYDDLQRLARHYVTRTVSTDVQSFDSKQTLETGQWV